jgi:hypothetical protein
MANGTEKKEGAVVEKKELNVRTDRTAMTFLAGAEQIKGKTEARLTLAINVTTNRDDLSTIMITNLKEFDGPVYITSPVKIDGKNLEKLIEDKPLNIKLPAKVKECIKDGMISCEAFYYTKTGPLLMVFQLKFEKGLLTDLGGEELGNLFDIQGGYLRVLRCPDAKALETLEEYCTMLSR